MRKRLWLLLLIVVLALTTLPAPSPIRSAGEIAPQVIDTAPVRGEEMPVESSITFYFDQPMDRASVEGAFKVAPTVAGALTWDNDSTATFKPTALFARNTEYAFSISAAAKSKTGTALREAFTLKLRTPGALEVTQILPSSGAKDIEATPTITIVFNRPVVPLLPLDELAKLPSPITITPSVEGKGEWINTTIYTFKPKLLVGGSQYMVTVNKGLKDVTGSELEKDVTVTFSTLTARIIEIRPTRGNSQMSREAEMSVAFSQPMDTTATEAAITLKADKADAAPLALKDFKWNESKTRATFKSATMLDYKTSYQLVVDKNKVRTATGGTVQADASTQFTTHDFPKITSSRPQNFATAEPFGGFSLNFSAPMKLDKEFRKRFTITPKPPLFYEDDVEPSSIVGSRFYRVSFSTEPSTDYKVVIDVSGITDIYGTPLQLDQNSNLYKVTGPNQVTFSYTTRAYRPEASLRTGSYIGLYSAYRPQTRVYSTHRNIGMLEMALYRVPFADFPKVAGTETRSDYQPKDFLRRWQVPVANNPNQLRYDLLVISDQGPSLSQSQNVTCLGAPPTRLKVTDTAAVLVDVPTPQRIRENAGLTARIVGQLRVGAEMSIVGGPICADQFVWWQVVSSDGKLKGWTAEGDRSRYYIGPKGIQTGPTPTRAPTLAATPGDPNVKAPALKPGIYFLEFSSPELSNNYPDVNHIMIVATANVTLKVTLREVVAWVTDLQSGKPLPNVDVKFSGKDMPSGAAAKTDASGLARFKLPTPLQNLYTDVYALVDDGKHYALGMSNWGEGISPWDFEQEPTYYNQDMTVYLYTERALYRPGQPVYFRGVVRARNDVNYSLSALKTIPVTIYDPDGKSLYQKDVELTPFGTFADSFKLDDNGALGWYRVSARLPRFGKAQDDEESRQFSHGFTVGEYRLPEFQVKVDSTNKAVLQGDKIKVTVDSSFFFGGAVSNARVEWYARTSEYNFFSKEDSSYNFIDYNEDEGFRANDNNYDNQVAAGEGRTDAQGKFTVELPADLGKRKRSQTFTIEATVNDESGQSVSGRVDVIVHQGQFYLGVRAQEYVGTAQKAQKINIVAVDWDSKPVPSQAVSVRVVNRVWSSVQTVEPGTGRTVWSWDVKENAITDGVVNLDSSGKGVYEFTPPKGGIYKVYVTSRDSKGNQITSSTYLWIAGPEYVPWRQQNSNRIDLKIDKESYKVGETASVLIPSPFQGEATALVTVERGGILKTDVITMTSNSSVYKLPITPEMAPNAYVSVMIVKGVDDKNPTAAFRMGLLQFGVETERLKLNIELKPDKPQAGPREKVTYTVKVTDYAGKPVQAEVGLALVDVAALSLMADQSTPILSYFYGKQGLSVRTSTAMILSVDEETQQIINTVKGGGGGGPEGGIFTIRQDYVTTPLWSPSVQTDANGMASVTVTLPDNLTTWRLDARAVTKPAGELNTTLVGQTTTEIISTKPLLVRPVTPRFYVVGDNSVLAAVVNNNTDQPQEVTARIDAKGVKVTGSPTLKGVIDPRGRVRFEWPVEVQDVTAVDVTFFVNSADGKLTDAAKSTVGQGDDKTLPVYKYEVPETVGTSGLITKEGGSLTEGIVLPRRYNITQGTLNIRFDQSLAAATTDSLKFLRKFQYECTEQAISRFLPNLMTYRALKQLGVDDKGIKAELDEDINRVVQRLYAEQKVDGGWGWFLRDESNELVTAYALIGLSEAKKQGFDIDDNVIKAAVKFVQSRLVRLPDQAATWQLNRQAFLIYAMARAGAGNVSQAITLFNIREKMSIYARAYLAQTFHLIDTKNTRYIDPLMSDLQNRAVLSATGASWQEDFADRWNWNTDTRTTAIVLGALVQIQPQSQLIPNVVRWLMVNRKAYQWETTQDTAWAVMSLTDWMVLTGELKPNYTFGVSINDKSLAADKKASPDTARTTTELQVAVKDLLNDQVNKLVINRTGGEGNLYYTAHLTAYLAVEQVKAQSRGISITRTYSLDSDPDRKPITQARVGDTVRVTLNVVAYSDLNYVMITDPIPAGAEGINPELQTSKIGQQPRLTNTNPLSRGWGWWWFSKIEMRDEKTVLYATRLPKGTYQFTYSMRPGLPGQYRVIPTTGQEFYFPETYGRSDGTLFTVLPSATNDGVTISSANK